MRSKVFLGESRWLKDEATGRRKLAFVYEVML